MDKHLSNDLCFPSLFKHTDLRYNICKLLEREGYFYMKEWLEQNIFLYALSGVCVLGLLIKLVTNLVYRRLVKASANMSTSKNRLVRLMKLKFETFYKLKIGVNNVDIFVDKYVYKHRFCGLLLSTWENLSGLILVVCLLSGPIISVLGLIKACERNTILSTFFAGICTSSLLIFVDSLFNISSKKRIIKLNMKDYLENYLKIRLEQEERNPELVEQYRKDFTESPIALGSNKQSRKEERKLEKKRKEQEKLLAMEAKQNERENRKRERLEQQQVLLAKKEEERLKAEEKRQQALQEKEEYKRRLLEEKMELQRKKEEEQQLLSEQRRIAKEEKAAKKRKEQAIKLNKEEEVLAKVKEQEEKQKQEEQEKALEAIHKSIEQSEVAATSEKKKKKTAKADRIRERNERLKEEIREQRELREKERSQGKDPFEVYEKTKKTDTISANGRNDFNMEYELRVKAAKRQEQKKVEEAKVKENEASKEEAKWKGNTPYEDKVIGDILKEFLA